MKNIINFIQKSIKYGIVGVINTLIALGVFTLLIKISVYYVIASTAGFLIGFTNSYLMNKFWTFKSSGKKISEIIVFCTVAGISYLFQMGVLIFLKESVHINVFISQIISMVIYTGLGFLGNNFITFKNKGVLKN